MFSFFNSYDMSRFSSQLKKIRERNNLSQSKVSTMVGINTDTLRKIENGFCIPKFETLEILSHLYKTDLLHLLDQCKVDSSLLNLYKSLDNFTLSNDYSRMPDIEKEIGLLKSADLKIFDSNDILQLDYLAKAIHAYNTKEAMAQIPLWFTMAMQTTKPNFSLLTFSSFRYNALELRILILVAIFYAEHNNVPLSNDMLIFILNYIEQNTFDPEDQARIKIKTLSNISYNYHLLDENALALKYAEKGIELALKNMTYFCLHLLYARKAIALHLLNMPGALEFASKSLYVLNITDNQELCQQYLDVYQNRYGISIQIKN